MLLSPLLKLLPLLAALAVAVTARPTLDNTAVRTCESDFARCLRLRTSLEHCRALVCSSHGDDCKPCRDDAFPNVTERAATQVTSDDTAIDVQVLDSGAGAKLPKNYCIVICTHANCGLLCTNPGHPPSAAIDNTEVAADTDATDLLDLTNAQSGQLGVPLVDGMITIIMSLDKNHGQRHQECIWICSGKVNCRKVCDAPGALVSDGGTLPEGTAVEGMGDCEVVEKGDVGPLMICQVPEVAGGDILAAGGSNLNGAYLGHSTVDDLCCT